MKKLLLLVGLAAGINVGLWGFFQFDLVAMLFHGNTNISARICYSLLGLSASISTYQLLGKKIV